MSDEEHHFESRADADASKTYTQQASTIRRNGYIVIENRPCKVVKVSTSETGDYGSCHFVAIDIFTAEKFEYSVPSSDNCYVPHVNRTDYQLIDITDDGYVSLLTDNGNTKDDLKLPTDDALLCQIIVAGNGERWAVPRSGFIDPESDSGTRVDSVRFNADSAFPQPDRRFRFSDSTVLVLESIE
ncbi:hypothetical protein ACQJBY_057368 [Aegilops geniculata]